MSQSHPPLSRIQANLLLLGAGAFWGMGFVAQVTGMETIGPLLFVALRSIAAALAILPLAMWEARRAKEPVPSRGWYGFILVGLLLLGGMLVQQIGLQTTTVTNSGFLTGLYVVMTPFLAVALFQQRPHPVVWPAAGAAFIGIWLMSGGGSLSALTPGDWLTILSAFFFSLQVSFIGRFGASTGRPITLSLVQFLVCSVLGLPLALALEPFNWPDVLAAMPEVLYVGIFSGGVAFTLQAVGQRYTTAPQAAIFLSSEAVFAATFAAIILGERLPPIGFAGAALIFVAMLGVEIMPALQARRRAMP